MKTAILYLLLLTHTTSLLRPLLPYAGDAVAHIFWYSKHVSTVHFENGKYHVHVEVYNAAKKTDSPNSALPGKSFTSQDEYIINHHDHIAALLQSPPSHFVRPPFDYFKLFSSVNYPPPRI